MHLFRFQSPSGNVSNRSHGPIFCTDDTDIENAIKDSTDTVANHLLICDPKSLLEHTVQTNVKKKNKTKGDTSKSTINGKKVKKMSERDYDMVEEWKSGIVVVKGCKKVDEYGNPVKKKRKTKRKTKPITTELHNCSPNDVVVLESKALQLVPVQYWKQAEQQAPEEGNLMRDETMLSSSQQQSTSIETTLDMTLRGQLSYRILRRVQSHYFSWDSSLDQLSQVQKVNKESKAEYLDTMTKYNSSMTASLHSERSSVRLGDYLERTSPRLGGKIKRKEAALHRAFGKLDLNGDDQLDRYEIAHFLDAAAKQIHLDVEREVIENAVDALLDDVESATGPVPYITRDKFLKIFSRHPDMMCAFDDESTLASLHASVFSRALSKEEIIEVENESEQVWEHARTHWRNQRVALVWLIIYLLANIAAFAYKGIKYANNDEAQAVFGNCVIVARGSAQCLNLNVFLILLPMCRHFITRVRAFGKLRFWFPFDAVLEFHILVGIAIAVFTSAHVLAHICDFTRFASADEEDIIDLFGEKLGDTIPDTKRERWLLMLKQPVSITGVIMLVCMAIAYATIHGRRKHFNTFWTTHHLFLVMLVALCFHGMGSFLEPFQSVYWVAGPLLLYLIPRFFRETKCATCQVLDVALKDGNVVGLKLAKPASWKNHVKSGMYAFVNIPKVSVIEWHPFTLTSAPHEDFIEFHFCQAGDWTSSVHALLKELVDPTSEDTTKNDVRTIQDLVVKVEGPIGASFQGFSDFPILVLVGAGIGVTPMISVLKQLLREPGKMKRTFLYWTVRDRDSFEWFSTLMGEIYDSDQKNVLHVRPFLTSVLDNDHDVEAILLHYATRAKRKRTGFDFVLGQRVHHQVEVGRPNWGDELAAVRTEGKRLGYRKCGIFLCGPQKMGHELAEVSFNLSVEDPSFHFYFAKEAF